MTFWRSRDPTGRLTDPAEARDPVETTFQEAQSAVNFVVFEPSWLPPDCDLVEVTLRPEQPPGRPDGVTAEDIGQTPWGEGNPCSLRAIAADADRRLRIKQFLYDWAPPAASVAPLWETPDPEPVERGDAVGWLGSDYKGNRGACAQLARTQIELSVLEGHFEADELAGLLRGLTPAAPDRAAAVRATPFHALNYWLGYDCRPPGVPHGLWAYNASRPYDAASATGPFALVDLEIGALVPSGEHYVLDSTATFHEAGAIEVVCRHRDNGSDYLWLTAAPPDSSMAPAVPPEASDQPAATREPVRLRDTTVHYAALTEEYGAWEAFWEADGVRYAAWAGATSALDGEQFKAVVDALEPV